MRIYILILANLIASGALLFSFVDGTVTAQVNPLQESTAVTATVIDRLAPSTPILIAPEDDEKLNSGEVSFIWQESTDNWLMDHYTLVLNNEILFDDIPLTATSSADYTLTYDSITGYYTLTVGNDLSDDNYTWSITAWDYHGNSTSSVTWSFSVDTEAPEFTITIIEDQEVEITTGDADSVPEEPIVLTANEPTLSGTGEANSSVELTIRYPDGTSETVSFDIDGHGEWSVTLEAIPRDGTIYLDFLITDETGNISILEDVPLILYTPVVTIPVPQVPFIPLPSSAPPVIEIPVIPPSEHVPPVIRQVPKKVMYFVRNATVTVSTDYINWLDKLLSILVPLLLLLLPLLKLGLFSNLYRYYLSGHLFKEILWLIGWWPEKNPFGIIVSREGQKPIAHALVLFSGKSTVGQRVIISNITNQHGIFTFPDIPEGEYRISVHHEHYFFPSLTKQPAHLNTFSYYTGGTLTVKKGFVLPSLVIPVEPIKKQEAAWSYQVRKAILLSPSTSLPVLLLSISICLALPSFFNISVALIYTALLIKKKMRLGTKQKDIALFDTNRETLPNVILSIQKKETNRTVLITQTSANGLASVKLPLGTYSLWCVDFKHSLMEGDNKTSTRIKMDVSDDYLPLVMKKVI